MRMDPHDLNAPSDPTSQHCCTVIKFAIHTFFGRHIQTIVGSTLNNKVIFAHSYHGVRHFQV
jgi:hypothetical protein